MAFYLMRVANFGSSSKLLVLRSVKYLKVHSFRKYSVFSDFISPHYLQKSLGLVNLPMCKGHHKTKDIYDFTGFCIQMMCYMKI